MPNWCRNSLTISGPLKMLRKFKKFAKGGKGKLDFNQFIPYPEKFTRQDEEARRIREQIDAMSKPEQELALKLGNGYPKDGYNSGGYEWCQANWGTKWNVGNECSIELSKDMDNTYLLYTFDTAWTPPLPIILAMSEKFPALAFSLEYKEEGNGFAGEYGCKGGEVINSEEREIEYNEEEEEQNV